MYKMKIIWAVDGRHIIVRLVILVFIIHDNASNTTASNKSKGYLEAGINIGSRRVSVFRCFFFSDLYLMGIYHHVMWANSL